MMRKLAIFSIMLLTLFVNESYADTKDFAKGVVVGVAVSNPPMVVGAVALAAPIVVTGAMMYGAYRATSIVLTELSKGGDCLRDPATGKPTCCATIYDAAKDGGRTVQPGGQMFCEFPNVRTCLRGGNDYANQGVVGKVYDLTQGDAWGNCQKSLCVGYADPTNIPNETKIFLYPMEIKNSGKVCWAWECQQGYIRNGGSCVLQQQKTQEQKNCESASGTVWNGKKCECSDTKLIWSSEKKQCVKKPVIPTVIVPEKVSDCDDQFMYWLNEQSLNYPDNQTIQNLIKQILDYCTNDKNREKVKFDTNVIQLKILIEKYKKETDEKITDTEKNIKSVADRINGVTKDFNKSVWKTTEGEFNKTRLLSDSVAGVVLGTAGGLITSSVIKKNQTDNGFDDISCTVGGQVVSGWGDEFTVGIR
jgi:hypothetical protein